jgi:hypothetical protein
MWYIFLPLFLQELKQSLCITSRKIFHFSKQPLQILKYQSNLLSFTTFKIFERLNKLVRHWIFPCFYVPQRTEHLTDLREPASHRQLANLRFSLMKQKEGTVSSEGGKGGSLRQWRRLRRNSTSPLSNLSKLVGRRNYIANSTNPLST